MQRIYTPRLPPPTSQTKTHNYLQLRKEALGQPTLQKKTGSLPSGWDTEQCPARGQQRLAWARGGQRGQGGHGGAGPRHSPSTLTALEARLQVTAPSSRCRPFLPLEEPHPPAPPSTPARLVQHDPRGSHAAQAWLLGPTCGTSGQMGYRDVLGCCICQMKFGSTLKIKAVQKGHKTRTKLSL